MSLSSRKINQLMNTDQALCHTGWKDETCIHFVLGGISFTPACSGCSLQRSYSANKRKDVEQVTAFTSINWAVIAREASLGEMWVGMG